MPPPPPPFTHTLFAVRPVEYLDRLKILFLLDQVLLYIAAVLRFSEHLPLRLFRL